MSSGRVSAAPILLSTWSLASERSKTFPKITAYKVVFLIITTGYREVLISYQQLYRSPENWRNVINKVVIPVNSATRLHKFLYRKTSATIRIDQIRKPCARNTCLIPIRRTIGRVDSFRCVGD